MRALVIVDVQRDFLPGGALGVARGDEVIPVIVALAGSGAYDLAVTTQDWHPPTHGSFAAEPEYRDGSWPRHCVQGTPGAELAPEIAELTPVRCYKGYRDAEAYSGFDGALSGTRADGGDQTLAEFLRSRGVTGIDVVGLATDYCVKATAMDGVTAGFDVRVPLDATRAVEPLGTGLASIKAMREAGVVVILDSATGGTQGP